MSARLAPRTNDVWLAALRGHDGGAVEELGGYLRRVLARVLRGRPGVTDEDLAEFTQEALLRIFASLDSFRGDSAFTTWATAVATRAAFTTLRRRALREKGESAFDDLTLDALAPRDSAAPPPDEALSRNQLLAALEHSIATELTDRQRVAVVAELRGVPTVEIAARLHTNSNALYKLHHDARKKLKAALLARGFTPDVVRRQVAEGSGP